MEFKVGDKIRAINVGLYNSLNEGDLGRVKCIDKANTIVVIMDKNAQYYTFGPSDIEHTDDEIKAISDTVNHPSHYTDGKIEVIDFIEDKKLNYHRGNAVKYIARAGKKDPSKEIEDLKKAQWYINREIKRLEGLEK